MTRFLPLLFALVLGCSGPEEADPTDDEPRTYTVELLQEDGPYTISGEITFPDDTPTGNAIQLRVYRIADPLYIVIEPAFSTDETNALRFEIVNADDGEYQVAARVDMNDSGDFDAGDLEGFYDGTVDAPIQDDDLAPVITVDGADVEGVDFGIGESTE